MPEGDTIFRAARTLHRALAGKQVTVFESALPALNRRDDDVHWVQTNNWTERSEGTTVGIRPRAAAVPALRDRDSCAQAGDRRAAHVLVSGLSGGRRYRRVSTTEPTELTENSSFISADSVASVVKILRLL